jgi:kynurenine formamidase
MKTALTSLLAASVLLLRLAAQQPAHNLTKADFDRMVKELSNWNRWGKDDQRGTVNLITPATRKRAAALVREGFTVSLAHNVLKEAAADNRAPFEHTMIATGASPTSQAGLDRYAVSYHGYAHTHLDALGHIFHEGQIYNGHPQQRITEKGAEALDILAFKDGIFARGVLVDIPRLKGLPYLEPSTPIYPEDLEAWEKKAGLKIASGAVVFIRTGRWARRAAQGPWEATRFAGLHASCARWLHQRDIAMIGSDSALDVMPSGIEGVNQPMHRLMIVVMGTPIFDNCDLEALGDAANQRRRWEFLFTAAPLAVPGGTGSPLNPIAVF